MTDALILLSPTLVVFFFLIQRDIRRARAIRRTGRVVLERADHAEPEARLSFTLTRKEPTLSSGKPLEDPAEAGPTEPQLTRGGDEGEIRPDALDQDENTTTPSDNDAQDLPTQDKVEPILTAEADQPGTADNQAPLAPTKI